MSQIQHQGTVFQAGTAGQKWRVSSYNYSSWYCVGYGHSGHVRHRCVRYIDKNYFLARATATLAEYVTVRHV